MRALERFEDLMEHVLEDSFTRLLRPQLQPVEMAKRLARSMEAGQTLGAGKVYVPNHYTIRLSPRDFAGFEPYLATLRRELAEYLVEFAREQEFVIHGRPRVTVQEDPALSVHAVEVEARLVDAGPTSQEAVLEGATARINLDEVTPGAPPLRAWLQVKLGNDPTCFALGETPLTLGRSFDNGLVLDDPRVSRHHAVIRPLARGFVVVDLGSTNGTFVNGERVSQRRLSRGDVISAGGVELRFETETEGEP